MMSCHNWVILSLSESSPKRGWVTILSTSKYPPLTATEQTICVKSFPKLELQKQGTGLGWHYFSKSPRPPQTSLRCHNEGDWNQNASPLKLKTALLSVLTHHFL